jgi:hypothetical protein
MHSWNSASEWTGSNAFVFRRDWYRRADGQDDRDEYFRLTQGFQQVP